jgi:hypothetical protein
MAWLEGLLVSLADLMMRQAASFVRSQSARARRYRPDMDGAREWITVGGARKGLEADFQVQCLQINRHGMVRTYGSRIMRRLEAKL